MLLALGDYRFSISTAAFATLERVSRYTWAAQERVGTLTARQFTGWDETISLDGVVYPHYRGGVGQIDAMRHMAGTGQPLLMVSGLGHVMGEWVIEEITETQSYLLSDGQPRKQEFRLSIARYGED